MNAQNITIRKRMYYTEGMTENPSYLPDSIQINSAEVVAIYSTHINRVYRYILINVGNVQDAQDLTSETFLAVLERLNTFQGEAELATWILAIARHKVADYFRANRELLPLEAATRLPSRWSTPVALVEQQWQLERVTEALQSVAPARAEALTLHIFADLSIAQVSQVLGKSESAVRMLLYRAIQDLKARLVPETRSEK